MWVSMVATALVTATVTGHMATTTVLMGITVAHR